MRRPAEGLFAVARLDFADVLRSRWLVFCVSVYALLAGVFVFVALRESAVLGFTGMSRVLMSFCHALVLLLPLLALTATGQVVNHARDNGTMEFLFSLPISRRACFAAITGVRFFTLLVPLVVLLVGMALFARVAFAQPIPWEFLGMAIALSTALLWAFVGIGLMVSTLVHNQAKAMIWLLLIWSAAVAMLDFALIGAMLQFQLPAPTVFTLAEMNPVQAVRIGLLSAVEPELSIYGPVGFYLANRVGTAGLFVLGIAWPAVLGLICWLLALLRFSRGDMA